MTTDDPIFEPDLVAFLDGECDAGARRRLRRRLRRDPDARARLALLRATDAALRQALADGAPRSRAWPRLAVAAAALLVVLLLVLLRPEPERGAALLAGNDYVELRGAPLGGRALPLFSDMALELRWRALAGHELHVVPQPAVGGAGPDRARVPDPRYLPLAITGTVETPDGRRFGTRFVGAPFHATDANRGLQVVRLREFELDGPDPAPCLLGRPTDADAGAADWREDFSWAIDALPDDAPRRLVPDVPGAWKLQLHVAPLPAVPGGAWPQFEPLPANIELVATGSVTPWSDPVDGLRVRLVAGVAGSNAGRMPIALQIVNESGRNRSYNVCGITRVDIVQPLHHALVVDGVEWRQRDDLKVIVGPQTVDLDHPDGTMRTVVVMPDYWRSADADGRRLGELPGPHRLQLRMYSKMLMVATPSDVWQGELTTPALELTVPGPR